MLALDAETSTGTAHEDVKHLVEGTGVINGNETTVETRHRVTFQCRPCGHQGTHGRHHIQVQDGVIDLVFRVVWEFASEVIHIALHSLRPSLSALLVIKPAGITTLVNILL